MSAIKSFSVAKKIVRTKAGTSAECVTIRIASRDGTEVIAAVCEQIATALRAADKNAQNLSPAPTAKETVS